MSHHHVHHHPHHHPQPSRNQSIGLWLAICLAGMVLAVLYALAETGVARPGDWFGDLSAPLWPRS